MQSDSNTSYGLMLLGLLSAGCMSVDAFATRELPADAGMRDSEPEYPAGYSTDGHEYYLGPFDSLANVGAMYHPVAPKDAFVQEHAFNQAEFYGARPCIEGELQLVPLDQRHLGGRAVNLYKDELLARLGVPVDWTRERGVDLNWDTSKFVVHFASDPEYTPRPALVGFDGPDSVDKAALTFADGASLTPTDELCEDGYAQSVVLGARYLFAFKVEFTSEKGRALFIVRRGDDLIAALGSQDPEQLYRDAHDAGMISPIQVGVLQVGGNELIAPRLVASDCDSSSPQGFANCADLLAALRASAEQFMGLLAAQPSVQEAGGYVPVRIKIGQRTW